MREPPPDSPPSMSPPEDRLDSWKEIAAYLERDVTTVQRWEKREGMPVHRHLHDRLGSVYASRSELVSWARSRHIRTTPENGNLSPVPGPLEPQPNPAKTPARRRNLVLLLAAAGVLLAIAGVVWLHRTDRFWRNPIADAQFQTITDFASVEGAAAISSDGHFVAFLSDRAGQMDVWVTQVGSGQFYNLTHGSESEIVNPSVRTLGFSPDGSLVTFWVRKRNASGAEDIGVWAVPTLGGEARPYLEGVSEFDWSHDGSQLAYHTPAPGDPLFIANGERRPDDRRIFTAPAGLHSHFPVWSPDKAYIYLVQGSLPDKLDIWRIPSSGGNPERITSHNARVIYPVLLDRRTLLYLASDSDGSGPSLYAMDVERRIPHRLTLGPDRYTSLAASGDGRRLVATYGGSKKTLWRLGIDDSQTHLSDPSQIPLTTNTGFSPRLGPDYLLYVSSTGTGDSILKLTGNTPTELWSVPNARIIAAPAIAPDGRRIAFAVEQQHRAILYVMLSDGTNARIVSDALDLQGAPAWTPDGRSITVSANENGVPHLFRVPVDGGSPATFLRDFSVDPAWEPSGRFLIYSGPDIGTTFSVKSVTSDAAPYPLPPMNLTRGARHLVFLRGGQSIVHLRGEIQHKDLWLIDLKSGAERQLTNLGPDFDIRDFDISPDGREIVLERVQERSDVVLLDLPR